MAKVLVIDDDPVAAVVLKNRLSAGGHECLIETTGARAMEAAKACAPDILVLDVMLPGVSGFEICRRIRRDADLYIIPILILSAMGSDEEISHGLAQGADDYVSKPYDMQNLIQRIEALLRSNADINALDSLTSLPGGDSTKRELQKRISRHEAFAVAYIELTQIREFTYRCGADARGKVIRRLGRALSKCGSEVKQGDFLAGHMGGGHFVCVMAPADSEPYCEAVRRLWLDSLPQTYAALGLEREYANAVSETSEGQKIPLLDVLCCVTVHDAKESVTSKSVFEILSHIRHRALETHCGGIHRDRRIPAKGTP